MGYEIIFHYKESASPGVYGEEVKTRSCKIGRVTEDVELDVLAAKIMSQLARRNVLITDVEIYEFAKKKLSYRETADGIVLKNKKFSFDSGKVVTTDEFDSELDEDFKPIPSPSKDLADKSCPIAQAQHPHARPLQNRRPIRHEMFEPEPLALHKAQQKGLKFTVGKKYPIYSESSMGTTVIYKTTDDRGRDVDVSSEYFMALGAGLIQQDDGPTYVGAENQKDEINLWGNYESTEMPDIRGRR